MIVQIINTSGNLEIRLPKECDLDLQFFVLEDTSMGDYPENVAHDPLTGEEYWTEEVTPTDRCQIGLLPGPSYRKGDQSA